MKIIKRKKKVREDKAIPNSNRNKVQKNNKQAITANFQESMREDKRGPMEGMEAVPSKKS